MQIVAAMPAEAALSGYAMPWRAGIAHRIAGSWYNQGGHHGMERYALDWNLWYEPVLAVKAGTVVTTLRGMRDPGGRTCKKQTGFGNYVVVAHPDGARSLYAHLSRVSVRNGQRVRQGAVLGISGNTGWSCGPHLHFRMSRGGSPIKPEPMGGYRSFPNNHGRMYTSHTRLNGPLPAATPIRPAPAPRPKAKPKPAVRRFARLVPTTELKVKAPTYTARELVKFSYRVKNVGNAPQSVAVFGVKIHAPDGNDYVLPCVNGTNRRLMPTAIFGCVVEQPLEQEGHYYARAGWLDQRGEWHSKLLPPTKSFTMQRPKLAVDTPQHVEATPSLVQGSTAKFGYVVHNPATVRVNVESFYVRVWKPSGSSVAVPCEKGEDVVLAPRQAFTCTASMTLDQFGTYTYRSNWIDERGRYRSDEIATKETFAVTEAPKATLTLDVNGTGRIYYSGTSCTSDCTKRYLVGTKVTLTASTRRGSRFQGWSGACSGTAWTCTVTLDSDKTATAQFTS